MRTRKVIALTVALLLLVSHTGFALTMHYCGDRISSVTSGFDRRENCAPVREKSCCAKNESHRKCCSDKTISVKAKKIEGLAKTAHSELFPAIPHSGEAFFSAVARPAHAAILIAFHCDTHAPPLFLRYCQLVFYA